VPGVPTSLLIHGGWRPASDGATFTVEDPATETAVAEVAAVTPQDIDDAIEAARAGFAHWCSADPWTSFQVLRDTARLIRERVESIATVMATEQGKLLAESRAEILATADQYDWYADEARRIYGRFFDGDGPGRLSIVRREPVGIVDGFSTWNFPPVGLPQGRACAGGRVKRAPSPSRSRWLARASGTWSASPTAA
jgi:succinate-semialdehyde dehydrogenase/glutarate-semialdehyde dehydrogenase